MLKTDVDLSIGMLTTAAMVGQILRTSIILLRFHLRQLDVEWGEVSGELTWVITERGIGGRWKGPQGAPYDTLNVLRSTHLTQTNASRISGGMGAFLGEPIISSRSTLLIACLSIHIDICYWDSDIFWVLINHPKISV